MLRRIAEGDIPKSDPRHRRIQDDSQYGYRPHAKKITVKYVPTLQAMAHEPLEAVGRKLGVTRERIRQLYHQYQIPRLTHRQRTLGRISKEALLKYTDGQYSQCEACAELETSPEVLQEAATFHGVELLFKRQLYRMLYAEGLQKCSSCHEIKPLIAFTTTTGSYRISGRHSICKKCTARNVRLIYQKQRNRIFAAQFGGHFDSGNGWKTADLTQASIALGSTRNNRWNKLKDGKLVDVTERIVELLTPMDIFLKLQCSEKRFREFCAEAGVVPPDNLPAHGAITRASTVTSGDSQAQRP